MKKNMNLKSFSDEQKKEMEQLVDTLVDQITEELQERVAKDDSDLELVPNKELVKKDRAHYKLFDSVWKSAGKLPGAHERISVEDLFQKDVEVTKRMRDNFSTDHPLLLPRVISNMAQEAIEPNLVLTPLLNRISFTAGTQITFPAFGAIHAADIPEGAEYPERTMELAGQTTATIGKSGVAIKITEEMVRYSQYDVMAMHIRAAGRALARWKEKKVADLITTDQGNSTIFDNDSASYRSTTGRNAAGAYNGTLTLDDIFHAYATMVDRGFTPNTLIMHPFAWQIFANEGIARAFGFINGVNPLMWQLPQGSPGSAPQWRQGGLNQNTYVSAPQQLATTMTNVPSIFPTNFRIIISPYMPFTASTSKTDIVFCDSSELGLLVVDEEVTTDEWEDKARDMRKMKFRERYALATMNDGYGIGILKNIKIGKSFDFADKISVSYGTGDLPNPLSGDIGYKGVIS